jgi:hypothetical protein
MIERFDRFMRMCMSMLDTFPWTEDAHWTHAQAEQMGAFQETELGKALAIHLRNCSLEINAKAVQSGDPHQCDRAAGFLMALSYIDNLSALKGAPQAPMQDEDSVEGADEFLERMAP